MTTIHGAAAFRTSAQNAVPSSKEWQVTRQTFDSHNSLDWVTNKSSLARSEGQAPVADAVVNTAHDNAKTVYDFYRDVLGRNGVDGKGAPIVSVVHGVFPLDMFGMRTTPNNAAWFRGQMIYGDGDGKMFAPLVNGLDVAGHEMAHGVTESTAKLVYAAQPGALNESWSDVFGELVEQYTRDPKRFADPAFTASQSWLIGEDVFTPGTPGDALRSMKAPGTANSRDDQPAHMNQYKDMPVDRANDNGGVHINSGIPNKAAYEAGVKIGGEKLAKIWYQALTKHMGPKANFSEAAKATITAAGELYASDATVTQAVKDAWAAVGVDPNKPSHVQEIPADMLEGGQGHSHAPSDGFVPPAYVNADYRKFS